MDNWYITPDIAEVKALDEYKLYLKFETGEEKIYDMKEWIEEYKKKKKLKDKEYFKNVKTRGCTIEWANGEDVAPEHLYHDSVPINEFKKQ